MLFVWQGLDFTDIGFWLTDHQQLYTDPDMPGFQSVCWLTTFIGHWIGVAFGGGVLAYKLGYVVVVTSSAMLAYQLLVSQLGRSRTLAAMVLALLFQSLAYAWQGTFRDSNNRFAMTHSIAQPLLVGTYTTAERAKVVEELLKAMSHFAKPGDEVLAHDGIPTFYFLTRTHPWLGIAWNDFFEILTSAQ